MRKRGFCCRPLSVCPSVTLVNCIHVGEFYSILTAEYIAKLLVPPGRRTTFLTPAPIPNSKDNTDGGGANYMGMGKKWRFSAEIAVYLGSGAR